MPPAVAFDDFDTFGDHRIGWPSDARGELFGCSVASSRKLDVATLEQRGGAPTRLAHGDAPRQEMPTWGDDQDSKGREKVEKVREMEAIVRQKERDQRKAAELAESQRQPHLRKRLQKRYGIGDGTTTQELLDRFVEPEPEPQQLGGGGGGDGKALVLSGSERQHLRSHVSLPKSQQRENTKAEVERLKARLNAIERRNTMTLEQYFPPEDLAVAKESLKQLRLNTTGYLARKVAEHKQKEEEEAEAKREREKSADVLSAASVGDHVRTHSEILQLSTSRLAVI